MTRIVVTAIFGGYERPKAPPAGVDRAILVTDTSEDDRWEVMRRPLGGLSPRRAFYPYKYVPHIAIPGVSANDDVLWIDGTFEPTGEDIGSLFDLVPPGGVGIHRHSHGSCFWLEAEHSHGAPDLAGTDRGALAMERAAHYEARGLPRHGGPHARPTPMGEPATLWEPGIIVWRGAQRTFGERVFAETMAWSASDQIAIPWVVHQTGAVITDLGPSVYENRFFRFVPHGEEGRTTRPVGR